MAAIRRHWQALVWIQACLILALAGWLYYSNGRPVRGQAGPAPKPAPPASLIADDPVVYTQIAALRREFVPDGCRFGGPGL